MPAGTTHALVQGTCVGFEIRSRLTFQTLREGGGSPLYVDEGSDLAGGGAVVRTWTPRAGNPFQGELRKDGTRYAFWASDAGWYLIDPTRPSITMTTGSNPLRREMRLFGIPTAVCLSEVGDISVHASAIEVGGQGVLLAGPSRYGKTTLAAAFARAGHRLLSEDSSRCSAVGRPSVWPGPAAVRLRPDVASHMEVPGARMVEAEQGRVPLVIEEQSRGSGAPVPLGAILILRASVASATPRLEPARSMDAIRDLLALTFHLPGASGRGSAFSGISDLVARVPAFNLYRPMTMDALGEVTTLLERHLAQAI